MTPRHRVLLALVLALPVTAHGQGLRSLEVNLGLGFGRGGTFGSRDGISADALVSVAIRPHANGMVVGALSAGVVATPSGDVCHFLPGGGCLPDFPMLMPLTLLVGWEAPGRVARFSAGPSVVLTGDGTRRSSTGGMMGRVDVLTPSPFHLALVISARALLVPAYRGDAISQFAVGVGLGIQ